MKAFTLEKIISKLTGRNSAVMRRNLGGTNLGLRRSYSAGETSLQEGAIIAIVITIDPLIERGMMMVMIYPSLREVSPAEQLCRSSRLVPPRFHLDTVALHPESFLILFSRAKQTLH